MQLRSLILLLIKYIQYKPTLRKLNSAKNINELFNIHTTRHCLKVFSNFFKSNVKFCSLKVGKHGIDIIFDYLKGQWDEFGPSRQ
jgi:hypothetical protein